MAVGSELEEELAIIIRIMAIKRMMPATIRMSLVLWSKRVGLEGAVDLAEI